MPRQYTTLQSGVSHGNKAQIKPPLLVIWIKAYISFSQQFKYFIWSFYLNNYAALQYILGEKCSAVFDAMCDWGK